MPVSAGSVVAAYVDGAVAAGLGRPDESLRKRVGRQAGELIGRGEIPFDALMAAARNMGAGGWNDLAVQVQRDAANANGHGTQKGHQPYRNPEDQSVYDEEL